MPESNSDPSGSTQQFRAFAQGGEQDKPRRGGRSGLFAGLAIAVAVVIVIAIAVYVLI